MDKSSLTDCHEAESRQYIYIYWQREDRLNKSQSIPPNPLISSLQFSAFFLSETLTTLHLLGLDKSSRSKSNFQRLGSQLFHIPGQHGPWPSLRSTLICSLYVTQKTHLLSVTSHFISPPNQRESFLRV